MPSLRPERYPGSGFGPMPGTPFSVTLDYQSKEDDTVTVRFRDSMEQVRVKRVDLESTLKAAIKDYKRV